MSRASMGEIRSKLKSNYVCKLIESITDPIYEDSYKACLLELGSGDW